MFNRHAEGAVAVERSLHESFFAELGLSQQDVAESRWIETYGGEEFGEIVQAVLALTDRIRPELSPAERQRAARRFITTSRYEWMFWEMGYRREAWPV